MTLAWPASGIAFFSSAVPGGFVADLQPGPRADAARDQQQRSAIQVRGEFDGLSNRLDTTGPDLGVGAVQRTGTERRNPQTGDGEAGLAGVVADPLHLIGERSQGDLTGHGEFNPLEAGVLGLAKTLGIGHCAREDAHPDTFDETPAGLHSARISIVVR